MFVACRRSGAKREETKVYVPQSQEEESRQRYGQLQLSPFPQQPGDARYGHVAEGDGKQIGDPRHRPPVAPDELY